MKDSTYGITLVTVELINEICPQMFLNNYWPALAVLAGQILGMYYPFLQKGEAGGGAGSPLFYITGDHGTGKSSVGRRPVFADVKGRPSVPMPSNFVANAKGDKIPGAYESASFCPSRLSVGPWSLP